jgi:VanZ family protein
LLTLNRPAPHRWWLLLAVLLLYWAIGYYPYNLAPYPNESTHVPGQLLRFDGPGIAYGREPPSWLADAISSSSLQVILEVRSAGTQRRWARIVSLSANSHLSNFSIVQDGNDLVVQVRDPDTDASGKPGHAIDDVFARPGWHRIELNLLPGLLTITVDGREAVRKHLPAAALSEWSPDYRLAVGNEFGFGRPWIGELRKIDVIVAGRANDYLRADALERPAVYHLPLAYRHVQWLPFSTLEHGPPVIADNIVNLLGFIPFGLALAMVLQRRYSLPAIAAMCCMMSLSIEAGQLYIATRTPSTDDLLLNTLGGTLGAWLGSRIGIRSGHGGLRR